MTALLALTALLAVAGGAEAADCAGLATPGRTLPSGDVNVLYGKPLQIDCHLDPKHRLSRGYDSSALRFFRDGDLVEPEFVTVLNATVLRLRIERPSISESVYQCQLQRNHLVSVCINNVIVGLPPEEVRDFSCVSSNWENLTCVWTARPLYAKTTYKLRYKLAGRSSRNLVFNCPALIDDGRGNYSCFWDLKTVPNYRQPYAELLFNLTGRNAFGLMQQNFTFDHFANLKPAPPQNLTCVDRTSRSAIISWSVPFQLETLPVGLRYRLLYMSERDRNWTERRVSFNSSRLADPVRYELVDLRYPNSWYDVRVSIGTERAAEDRFWSNYSSTTFRTLSEPPARPPTVDAGGFESASHLERRVLYVYWKQIEPHEENGENFGYEAIATVRGGTRVEPDFKNKVYALFENAPLGEVRVDLTSVNAAGRSSTSRLTIPAFDETPPEPQSFTKIAFDDGAYELSWRGVDRSDVDSYTIFWCDSSKDRPFQCDGRMDWIRVPAGINVKNVTMASDRIYQFAISANARDSSSGMVWASCTVIPGRVVDKMRSVWINRVGDTYVEIGWKLDCSDRVGVITGYRISYCPIVSPHNRTCKGAPMNKTIDLDGSQIHSNVTGLRPYTTYAISVSVLTRHGEGNPSDPLYNTTSEGPPTPPLNLRVDKIKNDSVVVSWDPPLSANGVLKFYEIRYNDGEEVHRVEADKNERSKTLVDLRSYANYTVNVTACTIVCSSPSDVVSLGTAVGFPGPVEAPSVVQTNSSRAVTLSWKVPARPGGTVDRYEIRVVEAMNNYNTVRSYDTAETEFAIPLAACEDPEVMIYYYYVRAINLDRSPDHGAVVFGSGGSALADSREETPDVAQYEGPWSQEAHHFCFANQGRGSVWIVLGGIAAVAAFVALVCAFRWVYARFQFMRNIKPSMPPGLETRVEELGSHASKWIDPGKRAEDLDESRAPPSSDAESLLSSKKPFASSLRGVCQRSDCSVNTDSTALSLTSSNRASDDSKNANAAGSESFSLDSSARPRGGDRGSRPSSAASTERWNLSEKIDATPESGPGAAPYSAIGAWPDDDDYEISREPAAPSAGRGYVAVGNIPNFAIGSPAAPLIDIAPEKKSLDPPPYLFDGSGRFVRPAEKPKANGGYVSVNDPRVTGRRPVANGVDGDDGSSASSYSDDADLFPSSEIGFVPETSDRAKRGDTATTNGTDASHPRKAPGIVPKRPDGLCLDASAENGTAPRAALSPEAYCRFGPNTNVPHSFEFDRADADGDYSAKDLDPEMLFFEEPPRSDRLIQSHYVPFKH